MNLVHAQAAVSLQPIPELQSADLTELVRQTIEQSQARLSAIENAGGSSVDIANAYADLGKVHLAHELMVQAQVAFANALMLMPDRSDWHYLVGIIEYADGRIDESIAAYDRALDQAFPDVLFPALIRRGRAWLEKADWDRAGADFDRALSLQPDSAAAIGGLGRVALRSSDPERAVMLLNQAVELDPSATRLHQMLGLAYRELGRIDEARAEFALSGEGLEGFDDPVLASVQAQSLSPQFYLESGLAQAEQGNYEAAAAALSLALQLDPDDTNILLNYANLLARIDRFELARGAYERATELEPNNPEAWLGLGQLDELEDSAMAFNRYRRALQVDVAYEPARAAMAYLYLKQNQPAEALSQFEQLTNRAESTQDQARWWYWQGIAQIAQNQCESAGQAFEQSIELAGISVSIGTALARLRATCLASNQAELVEAADWAEQIYESQPGLGSAETLAMVYAAQSRFDDALDLQAQAIFEALKNGTLESNPHLQANMALYEQNRPAPRPFAANDPVFVGDLE
ncbi:MAG: tetratricopeptide repeat protein [Pseudomonadota bacterium]